MKKNTLLFLLLIFAANTKAQFGDANSEVDNLTHLAKVWGFVKYFHPSVMECETDWDQALITTLSDLNGAPQSNYNTIVEAMIDMAGPAPFVPGSQPPVVDDEELNNLDWSWIQSAHFSPEVQAKLVDILEKSRNRSHCLLGTAFANGNLTFDQEDSYASLGAYPDINYRLLAIFRYWNAIDYFFPYKHIMDQDWNTTLEEFILPVAYAQDETSYHINFKEFTTHIVDSHSFFNSNSYYDWRGRDLSPFQVKYIENETVITAVPSSTSDLEVGDIVREMDGQTMEDLRNYLKKYNEASNEPTTQRNIHDHLIWGPAGAFEMTVEKADGSIETITNLNRSYSDYYNFHVGDGVSEAAWKSLNVEGCDFGYVNMGILEVENIQSMVLNLWSKDAIIFDVRNYPNGTMWSIMPYLFNEPVPIASFTAPNQSYAGKFSWSDESVGTFNGNNSYEGTLIFLFNEETQSQAEYTIMGMENHPNSIKIGSQTAGADGNVSFLDLPGNIRIFFTGLGTYYPDRTPTQRIGIVPDIEVKPTIDGVRNDVDEVLEFAMDCNLLNITSTYTVGENPQLAFTPNPFHDNLQVNNTSNETIQISIYDVLGNLISQDWIEGTETVDVSKLTPGVYMAHWRNDKELYTKKLVKQ